MIRLDTVSQNFIYQPSRKIINKFDVFNQILVFSLDLLLSAKILAAMKRKTAKGRDFFDIVYLISLTKPNMVYLQQKLGVNNGTELKQLLLNRCKKLNFEDLARDVEPFLFDPRQKQRVLSFKSAIEQINW